MTQNQLRYWELRWKQHYENILANVEVAKVNETARHNLAVERETARHNRRQEKIDTQNMIINRMNLEARWSELDEKKRAALVAEALNEKKYQLEVEKELHNWTYTQAQIRDLLQKEQIAAAEFAMSIIESKHNIANKYLQSEASIAKAGWGKDLAAEVVANVKSSVSNHEFDELLKAFSGNSDFEWLLTTFGPAAKSEVTRLTTDVNSGTTDLESALDYDPKTHNLGEYKRYKYDRDRSNEAEIDKSIAQGDKTSADVDNYLSKVSGFSNTNTTIFSDTGRVPSNTSGGTNYHVDGGHKSTGIIYA